MKKIFIISAFILIATYAFAIVTLPRYSSKVPILYWTTDPNPARMEQIQGFEEWMEEKGYPPVNLRLDTGNLGVEKIIIQSAAGVASDIVQGGAGQLRFFVKAGILKDVTHLAKDYGFGIDKTYRAVKDDLFVDDRQYGFPCNVTASPLTLNAYIIRKEGLPEPKFNWNWEEFLDWCRAVSKERKDKTRRYAVTPFGAYRLWPGNGGPVFNETMTRCIVDSPQVKEATEFYYDLMFKYKVMATPAAVESMAAQSGYGGTYFQMLGHGDVLGHTTGRYSFIQLRRFETFEPEVALLPYNVMPLQKTTARTASITHCAEKPELAARFLQYLAEERYNRQIVKDADALPPNPGAAKWEIFTNPPEHPEEGPANVKYYRAAAEYGVGKEYSPYVNPFTVKRIIDNYLSGLDSQAIDIDTALQRMQSEINKRIDNTLREDKQLQKQYDKAMIRQEKINQFKKQGKDIPLEWIKNPVIRKLAEAGKWPIKE